MGEFWRKDRILGFSEERKEIFDVFGEVVSILDVYIGMVDDKEVER